MMKILIAEDNHFYRLALKSILAEWGYEVMEASHGAAAWHILQAPDAPKMAILDWMMPQLSGLEVCRRARALQQPEPPYIIMLTCLEGKENIVAALDAGADDFIQKPFDREQLRARLQVGRRIVGLQTSQTVVFTFARAVEAKSPYTHGHAERVTAYALQLARRCGVSEPERETLRRGALLHDIGKISIPDTLLDKPGRLTAEEYDLIKKHPVYGVDIVKPLQSLQDTLPLIRWHHERLDGKGYPDGLGGSDIPRLVRILSVADVYDALASERPYRAAMAHTKSLELMRQDAAGGGLDPELVELFVALPPETFSGTSPSGNASPLPFTPSVPLSRDAV
jgi:putative two-component system response regulator